MTDAVTIYDLYLTALTSTDELLGCQDLASELLKKAPDAMTAAKRLIRLTLLGPHGRVFANFLLVIPVYR